MEALELVFKGHIDDPVAFACPKCGIMFSLRTFGGGPHALEQTKAAAVEHCLPKKCECGAEAKSGWTICQGCSDKKNEEKEQKLFDSAKKITIDEYSDDPIYWEDGPSGDMGDGYFSSMDDLLDRCEEDEYALPVYVWATKVIEFRLNADNAIESALSEHHEDAAEQIDGKDSKELQEAMDAWSKKQGIRSFEPDYTRAILLCE